VPEEGYFTLLVPDEVGITFSEISYTCLYCNGFTGTPTYDDATRIMTFNIFTSYTYAGQRFIFSLKGFTNPGTSAPAEFQWASYALISSVAYPIDTLSGLTITASLGELTVTDFYPTDNNFIYGRPTNYTLEFNANH